MKSNGIPQDVAAPGRGKRLQAVTATGRGWGERMEPEEPPWGPWDLEMGWEGGLQGAPPAWGKHGARREQEGAGGVLSQGRRDGIVEPGGTWKGQCQRTRRDIVGWGQKGPGRTFLEIQEGWYRGAREDQKGAEIPGEAGGTSP